MYYLLTKVPDLEETLKSESRFKEALADLQAWISSQPSLGVTELRSEVVIDGQGFAEC
ncbi:MAG: hypothetical protein IPK04_09550 [Bdellovibrionales bacterium]|nr:hypothetical protein [Bdellovibrionales bacterium]